MTKKEILEMTGLSEQEFYRQYPTQESWTESYKKGGWIQKATASIKRRGTEGKCTPMSKPGCTGRALALAKTFHKMAAKRKKKEDGGMVDMYGGGGETNPPYIAPRESTNTVFTPYQKPDPNAKSQYFRDPFFDYAGSIALGLSPLDTPADIISAISDLKNQRYDNLAFSSAAAFIPGISGLTLKTLYSDAKPYIQEKVYEYYKSKRDKKKKDGGTVDVYQLMGMPTPAMYGMGGYAPIGMYSHVMSRKNVPNMGMAYGGQVPMYKLGSVLKDIGAGAYGAGEGLLDTLTMGATDQLTDQGYKGLQKLGGSSKSEMRQQDSIRGYSTVAGAITGAVINPSSTMTAVQQGTKGLGQGIAKGSPDSKLAQDIGTYLPMAGNLAGMAAGAGAFGDIGGGAAGMAQSADFAKSGFGQFAQGAGQVGKGYNQFGGMMGDNPMSMLGMFGVPMAMGGAVNYPEGYQKNITFARGGMTGPLTEINVEKGELLTDKDGRIVTKYRGGGMVPHPEEGMDERGTVPAQEGMFVITKAQAKNYEKAMNNSDKLYADAIRNNISYDKTKKEAAEEQAAMTAMDKFVAKYGGTIQRMYAKGGMVPMYNRGSNVVGPRADAGYFDFPNNNYFGNFPDQVPYKIEDNESWGFPASNITNPVPKFANYLKTLRQQSIRNNQDVTIPTYARQGVDADGNPVSINPNAPSGYIPSGFESMDAKDMSNFGKYAENAAMFAPGLYNLGMGLFSKPEKFNKLKLSGELKSYDTPYQTDYRSYNAMKDAMRRSGQPSTAGLTQLFNTFSAQEARNRFTNREENLRRRMAADQFNLSRADQIAQTNLGIDQLNAQQRAARRNMIAEGISNIGQVAAYNKGIRQDKNVLGDLYKNLEFTDGKWVHKR